MPERRRNARAGLSSPGTRWDSAPTRGQLRVAAQLRPVDRGLQPSHTGHRASSWIITSQSRILAIHAISEHLVGAFEGCICGSRDHSVTICDHSGRALARPRRARRIAAYPSCRPPCDIYAARRRGSWPDSRGGSEVKVGCAVGDQLEGVNSQDLRVWSADRLVGRPSILMHRPNTRPSSLTYSRISLREPNTRWLGIE